MSKFTPGPWHYHRNNAFWEFGSDEFGQIGDVCSSGCAHIGNGDPSGRSKEQADQIAESNARLIAAAPCLLDALESALWMVESFEGKSDEEDKTVDKVRAAIAKATKGDE